MHYRISTAPDPRYKLKWTIILIRQQKYMICDNEYKDERNVSSDVNLHTG